MARTNVKGRSKGDLKHVRLYPWMMDSPAYRTLPLAPRGLLPELYRRFNGANNGDVFLSCRDAALLLGLSSKDTASRAFAELEKRGFIKARQRSAFTCKARLATTWILTEFEYAGALPTKDFMRWRPGMDFRELRAALKAKPGPADRTDGPADRTKVRHIGPSIAGQSDRTDCATGKAISDGPMRETQVIYHEGGAAEPQRAAPLMGGRGTGSEHPEQAVMQAGAAAAAIVARLDRHQPSKGYPPLQASPAPRKVSNGTL